MNFSNLIYCLTSMVMLFLLTSCDRWLGVNITDKSQMARFQEQLQNHIGPEMQVTEICFVYADQRSPDIMGSVSIDYVNPNEPHTQKRMRIALDDWQITDEELKSASGANAFQDNTSGISIADCDFTVIPAIIKQSESYLASKDLECIGIQNFTVRFEGDPVKPAYRFEVCGHPKGYPVTTKGRYAAAYYYDVEFTVDTNNKWDMKTDDKLKTRRGWH